TARLAYWECSISTGRLRAAMNMSEVLGVNPANLPTTLDEYLLLAPEEDRLRLAATAIDHAGDAIVIFDARGAIMSVNSAFTRITGYSEPEAQGQQLDELLNRPSGKHDESFFRRLLGRLRTYGRWKGELWARAKNGRGFAMLLSLSEIRDDKGRVSHHVGVFTDVSRQKEYKERLEVLALHDSLTGLPNRALFLDRGQQALSRATRNSLQIGVIFIDLDLFKRINDTWGHAVGDEVLRRAGERMRDAMRDCDTVARLGGDEFVVLLTDVKGVVSCIVAAERLLEVITEPYAVNGISVALGASLGIALSPQHGDEIRCLLHQADQALYSIKRNDVRRIAVWSPSIQEERAPVAEGLPSSNRSALRS
ncbi:MAG TPA: diguanylate cyclase, partial [Burkholderiaceae bacterium]|nr:diguanylate cyclase [Burkholderiaceae bacterium]